MCGIAGVLYFDRTVDREVFSEMLGLMAHRGPDDEGYLFVDTRKGDSITAGGRDTPADVYRSAYRYAPDTQVGRIPEKPYNLALGSRRLAILDLSPGGHMPMCNDDRTIWIVHNGEVYNFREIREELKSKGYMFHSDSDTEVILKSYEEWNTDCLSMFNGMWAFCIWDSRIRQLFCARDRLGIKPFYYFCDRHIFAMASEIKALLELDIERRTNERLIYDFLRAGVLDHTEETFFEGVEKLPQAHYILLDEKGNLTTKRYWDVEISNEHASAYADSIYAEEFLHVLTDAVRLRLRSDVSVGSCLSGGLDSSSIVCLANRLMFPDEGMAGRDRQKTFSSCFEDKRYDERDYIEEVSRRTRAEKNLLFPSADDFVEDLNRLIRHQEEPFDGTGIYAQWCVMKAARERGVTVLLDGQGGDEQLAGYRKFYAFFLMELLKRREYSRALAEFWRFFLSRDVIKTLNMSKGLRYIGIGNKIMNVDGVIADSFHKKYAQGDLALGLSDNLGNRMKEDLTKYSLPVLLRYEDKNSMAHSVEARLPFLDYRVVEKLASYPLTQKMHRGWTKFVLRNAMSGILPEKVRLRRSKLGFSTPEDDWIRLKLSNIMRETFERSAFIGSYMTKKTLISYFDSYMGREMFYQKGILFRFFILELWGRMFVENVK